ncbi:MAG: hypothetical protein JWM12_270 [Ilumatobacteraceae bacterium]|nr:hypothetical protein [Ilumatobacteraceae bacterium]
MAAVIRAVRRAAYDRAMELLADGARAARATARPWRVRALPVACCTALAGAALVVAHNDPAASNSHFPGCAFHAATGLWCPGCGLTRGVHALLNGHIGQALSANVFTPFVVVALVVLMISWLRTAWGRSALRLRPIAQRRLMVVGPAVVLLYGVLRNVPVAPLRTLAP